MFNLLSNHCVTDPAGFPLAGSTGLAIRDNLANSNYPSYSSSFRAYRIKDSNKIVIVRQAYQLKVRQRGSPVLSPKFLNTTAGTPNGKSDS